MSLCLFRGVREAPHFEFARVSPYVRIMGSNFLVTPRRRKHLCPRTIMFFILRTVLERIIIVHHNIILSFIPTPPSIIGYDNTRTSLTSRTCTQDRHLKILIKIPYYFIPQNIRVHIIGTMKHSGCSTRVLTIVTLVLFTVTSIDAYAYVSIPPNHSPSFVVGGTSNIPSASSCFAPDNRNPMSCRQTYINTNPRTRTSCTAWATKTSLHLSSKNNNEEPEDSKNEVDPNLKKEDTPTSMSMSSITRKMTVIWKLLVTKFMKFFPTFRVALASFTVGAVLALSLIFIPVYNAVDKMSEPVTLFETILAVSSSPT